MGAPIPLKVRGCQNRPLYDDGGPRQNPLYGGIRFVGGFIAPLPYFNALEHPAAFRVVWSKRELGRLIGGLKVRSVGRFVGGFITPILYFNTLEHPAARSRPPGATKGTPRLSAVGWPFCWGIYSTDFVL